ncbi:hypothetical protein JAAARDRAFT_164437 [Jaapia argillacea MUCL 33604]|uniref:Major facilitator superfamily (MFS) profile domain-containing protein n=1 Tax=Jaapia argillacea MUCL 33604 TaxID=933084 RepID=A0A067PI26_9AGAM|nr:hypothetical protein JAAARDRAFT_164437 [Jaapia argillacea MUCL 33604]
MTATPHNDADYYVPVNRRILVSVALALILFISALDSTIVAVALPKIGSDFNDYQSTSWVVTAYIITYTAFLPIVSKLTDIIGRKYVLLASTIFFMAFSGACGGAKSLTELIVFRALQGIGGSAIYSGVVVTISTMVPQESVAKYTSIIGTVFALSSVAGPLVGGAIVEHVHWGWIFFVNLPIGFVGALMLQLFLTYPASQAQIKLEDLRRRIDWVGSFLLLACAVLLALSLQIGGTPGYPWVSAKVLTPLAISVVLIPIFLWVETKHPEPILPLRLFRSFSSDTSDCAPGTPSVPPSPNFNLMVIYTICLGAALYSTTVFLPQRLQIVDSLSPIGAGVKMLPILLPTGLLSPFAGATVMLSGSYRPLMTIAAALGAIGAGLLSTINGGGGTHTNFGRMYGYEVIEGVCIGVTITVSTIIIQFSVDRKDLATATGFQSFSRMLGGLIGIAISTAIVNVRVSSKLDAAAATSQIFANPSLRSGIMQGPTVVIPSLDPQSQDIVKAAYSSAYSLIFVVIAAWFAVGTVSTLGLKHIFPEKAVPAAEESGEEMVVRSKKDEENSSVLMEPKEDKSDRPESWVSS